MSKPNKTKLRYTALFTITGLCNDDCKFCIKYDFIKKGYPDLTFNEIKKNYFLIKNKFKIEYITISGGEPTLHPQIFEILDFFKKENIGIRLVTNLLRIGYDPDFFKRLKPYFPSFNSSRLLGSINDLPSFSKNAKLRMRGLVRCLKASLRVGVITLIYRDNVKDLPRLAWLLRTLFQKYPSRENGGAFNVELRSVYISETPKLILEKVLPRNFTQVKKSVEDFIAILTTPRLVADIVPWHFPLCYIKNFNRTNLDETGNKYNTRYVWVDKNHQLKKIKVLGDRGKQKICQSCLLKEKCTGMCNKEYMDKYDFPPFRPIKRLCQVKK